MSKMTNALNAIGLHNNHNLLTEFGGVVAVEYRANPAGRLGYADCDKTTVFAVIKTAHLETTHIGNFTSHKREFVGNRRESFQEAVNWAEKTFGCTLVVSPFGGMVPQSTMERAKKSVKDATIAGEAKP